MTSDGDARRAVVVGVDGSEGSVAALRWAAGYAAATGTPVRAVLAWHYPTAAAQPPVGHAPEAVNKEVRGPGGRHPQGGHRQGGPGGIRH